MVNLLNKKNHHLEFQNASAAIIVNNENKYLVQLRDNVEKIFYPNHWGLFGGASEKNEDPLTTVSREILEEISIKINDFKYFTKIKFDLDFIKQGQIERTYYTAEISIEEENIIQLNEGKEYKFISQEDLLSLTNLVPYDAYVLWLYFNYLSR